MPLGIRPSNVRVCHSTTRASLVRGSKLSAVRGGWQVSFLLLLMIALETEFDLEFPDAMLSRRVFESIDSISAAIESLQEVRQ